MLKRDNGHNKTNNLYFSLKTFNYLILKIGNFPQTSLSEARVKLQELKQLRQLGRYPVTELKDLKDKYDLNNKKSLLNFLSELHDKLEKSSSGAVGIESILRKGRSASEVYDFLYDLAYLKPRYTLMFQDAHIEQLSPGQRGSLLLIFYLLVDNCA
ncbi:hypothetical protein [Proteus faecis]|uniref:hypothetical protein n=1 Tax=Proteus faecis TaxID=2050967 RepID=UPI003075DEDF